MGKKQKAKPERPDWTYKGKTKIGLFLDDDEYRELRRAAADHDVAAYQLAAQLVVEGLRSLGTRS
jgi:hypothetical protein